MHVYSSLSDLQPQTKFKSINLKNFNINLLNLNFLLFKISFFLNLTILKRVRIRLKNKICKIIFHQ